MNKKGFTLVELVTTFALASIIIILLINVILVMKNLYTEYDIKTQLLINQGNLSKALNSKINSSNTVYCENCILPVTEEYGEYNFNLLNVETITLKVTQSSIKFGGYVYKAGEGTTIEKPIITVENESDYSFLVIKIPIKNKLYPNEDFGVTVVYTTNFS